MPIIAGIDCMRQENPDGTHPAQFRVEIAAKKV
jgi:hypothetical protein